MPDLTDAIEELRQRAKAHGVYRLTPATDTILNAVLSGDLIPLAHHNAMIGAIVEKAVPVLAQMVGEYIALDVLPSYDIDPMVYSQDPEASQADHAFAEFAARAITPADARAALDEAISRAREVKPLVWTDSGKGYIHADRYRLVFNGFGWHLSESDAATGKVRPYKTPEAAKAAAQADYTARIHAALAPVDGAKA